MQSARLVGRAAELEGLDRIVAAVRDHHAAMVLSDGEAGIGKTRLVTRGDRAAESAG